MNIKNIIFGLFIIIANINCVFNKTKVGQQKIDLGSSLTEIFVGFIKKVFTPNPQKTDISKGGSAAAAVTMLGITVRDIRAGKFSNATSKNLKGKFFGIQLAEKSKFKGKDKTISYFVHNVLRVSLKALMATVLSYFAFRNWDKIADHTRLDKAMFGAGLATGGAMALFYAGTIKAPVSKN